MELKCHSAPLNIEFCGADWNLWYWSKRNSIEI